MSWVIVRIFQDHEPRSGDGDFGVSPSAFAILQVSSPEEVPLAIQAGDEARIVRIFPREACQGVVDAAGFGKEDLVNGALPDPPAGRDRESNAPAPLHRIVSDERDRVVADP